MPKQEITLPKFDHADCETCPLRKKRFSYPDIIGVTNKEDCRIAWVGESPGGNEIYEQKVFVGDTGHILRAVIEDLDLEKYGGFLTNVLPCDVRTIDKDGPEWLEAVEHCRNRLIHELEEVNPDIIVVMGDKAKKALAPFERLGIMKLSGEWGHSEELGKDFLYVFHPAFILHAREGERYFSIWQDHIREAKLYFEAEPFESKTKVAESVADVYQFVEEMADAEEITADVETTSFSPHDTDWSVTNDGRYFEFGRLLCISLCADGETSYVIPDKFFEDDDARVAVGALLRTKKVVCHNAMFDLPFIWRWIETGIFAEDDTMFKSYSMDETPWHGLKRLGRKHLGVEDWSVDTLKYRPNRSDSFANIPDEVLFPYAGKDTIVTSRLNRPGVIPMTDDATRLYKDFLMPVSNMFTEMSYRGILVDPKALVSVSNELEELRLKHLTYLKTNYGITNPNSWLQIYNALFDQLRLDIPEEVKTGKNFLDTVMIGADFKGEVNDWTWEVSEFAKNVVGYRSAHKGKNTYVRDVARSMSMIDWAVHPDYKLFATVTGRIVINNPTFTNYTKAKEYAGQIRRPLVSRPGWKWVHVDYKQFELRIYAGISRDPKMLQVLTTPMEDGTPRDPHNEVAFQIYGPTYLEMNEQAFGFLRTITKTMVFGRLYGRGPGAMSAQLEVAMDEATRICGVIDSFWDLSNYHGMINERLDTVQEIVNPLGRSRRFPLITSDNRHRCFNQACNYLIQSTASDLCLLSAWHIWREFGDDVHILFTIHDSIEFEIREDKFDEIFPKILNIMKLIPQDVLNIHDIPIEVDYVIGDYWEAA